MSSTGVDRITGVDPSVAIKAPCAAASVSNITLSGAQTIDGVAVTETTPKTRVLVTGQTSAVDNGIYDVYATAWVRSEDFNGSRDVVDGTLVSVDAGTAYTNSTWKAVATNPIAPGTTSIAFVRVNNFDSAIQSVATIAAAATAGLTAGQEVITSGYYAANDGGGAHYIVVTTASVAPVTYIDHDIGGGLTMYLKNRNIIHVEQAGVLQSDATKSPNFRAAVATGKVIYALGAAYTLDYFEYIAGVDACLRITAGKEFIMGGSTVITSTTSVQTRAAIIGVWRDDDNVVIRGGTLAGDRASYVGPVSESRHGIWIGEADSVNVYGTKCVNCHGDGYYISGWPNNPTVAPSTNIFLHDVAADNNYRNNMSLTFVDGFDISAKLTNANGTSPQAGLDIEPNANQYVKNGRAKVFCQNNTTDGLLIYGEAASTEIFNVEIDAICLGNGNSGFGMSGLSSFNVKKLSGSVITEGNTGTGFKCLYLKDSNFSVKSSGNLIAANGDIRLNGCDGVSIHNWSSVTTTATSALEIRDSDRITISNNLRSDCRSAVGIATIYIYSGSTNVTLNGVNVTGSNTIGINADSSTSEINICGGTVNDCSLTTTAASNAINIRSAKGSVTGLSIDQPGTVNATNFGVSMGSYIITSGNLISGYTTAYESVGAGNVFTGLNVVVP